MDFLVEKFEELLKHCQALEARVVALEQHAHSSHTIDGEAIAVHVNQRLNDHLRDLFTKKQEVAAPTSTPEEAAPDTP